MARLDVYRATGARGYLLDCQSDMLTDLETNLTVPLFLYEDAPKTAGRLNPISEVGNGRGVMMTQYASAVRTSQLGKSIGTVDHEHDAVRDALGTLLVDY